MIGIEFNYKTDQAVTLSSLRKRRMLKNKKTKSRFLKKNNNSLKTSRNQAQMNHPLHLIPATAPPLHRRKDRQLRREKFDII